MPHQIFICHASADKDVFVRPLATALRRLGLDIWYDDFELRPGDSLRRKVDAGLLTARYAAVVLSPAFFAGKWASWELSGIVQRHLDDGPFLIPIWLHVAADDVRAYSPPLADLVALRAESGAEAVAEALIGLARDSVGHSSPMLVARQSWPRIQVISAMLSAAASYAGLHFDVPPSAQWIVHILDDSAAELHFAGSHPSLPAKLQSSFPLGTGLASHVVETNELITVSDYTVYTNFPAPGPLAHAAEAILSIPIRADGEDAAPVGVLSVSMPGPRDISAGKPFVAFASHTAQTIAPLFRPPA